MATRDTTRTCPPGSQGVSRSRLRLFYPLVLVAAGVLTYLGSFRGVLLFDDYANIIKNSVIRDLGSCWNQLLTSPRSLTTLSLAVNFAIGGLEVQTYHAVNLILHLLAGLALYGLVRRTLLLPRFADGLGRRASELALAISLLWLLHPLQTECVTYVVHRGEALGGLFYLLTLFCLLRGATGERRRVWYVLAVLACALSMKSKEIAVTAPVVALLFDRTFLAGSWREILRRRWPVYLGLVACWVLLMPSFLGAFRTGRPTGASIPSSNPVAIDAAPSAGFGLRGISPLEYARSQPGVIVYYLRLALWPDSLCIDYSWPVAQSPARILPPAILVTALLLASVWVWIRSRPLGFLGICFFLILAPTSSIMPIADLAVERRMYLPLVPVVILFVVGGYRLLEAYGRRRRLAPDALARLEIGVLFLVALVLGALTFQRNEDYRSELDMWRDVTIKRPDNARGHNELGRCLTEKGDLDQAERCIRTAILLNPNKVKVYSNLGRVFMIRGQYDKAARCFIRELQLNPRNVSVLNLLGGVLFAQRRYEEAIHYLNRALQIDSSSALTHGNLGSLLLYQKKFDDAIRHLQTANRLAPNDPRVLGNLGRALRARDRARANNPNGQQREPFLPPDK